MFSLALCTYNRAALLTQALGSLAACEAPPGDWELLLIDNNSRDATRAVAESFIGRLPLRYVFEPEQGLSRARNRALRECRGDFIVFTDDDILVDSDWLRAYAEGFFNHSEMGYFGGPIQPYYLDGKPSWIKDESMPLIGGLLGYYTLGDISRPYAEQDMHPFGANFALARRVFERYPPFRNDLGVVGNTPGRGEEAEYFGRVRADNIPGYYLAAARCRHVIQSNHLTLRYLYRYGVQKGIASVRIGGAGAGCGSRLSELEYGLKGAWQLLKGRGDRARQCVINMGIQRGLRDWYNS